MFAFQYKAKRIIVFLFSGSKTNGKLPINRHASFETLLAVASVETDKMNSAPSSPSKASGSCKLCI